MSTVTLDLVCRTMTPADLPAARALWAAAEGVELCAGDELEQLHTYLLRNPGMSQVAERGGVVLGAVLAGHDGRRGYLYHLAVDPSLRGQGVGRSLVERSLARLRAAGVVRALILVASENDGGAAFWSRTGWEPLETARPMGLDL